MSRTLAVAIPLPQYSSPIKVIQKAARQLTLDAIRKIPTLAVAVLLLPTPIKKR